jgi:hypothetical protein
MEQMLHNLFTAFWIIILGLAFVLLIVFFAKRIVIALILVCFLLPTCPAYGQNFSLGIVKETTVGDLWDQPGWQQYYKHNGKLGRIYYLPNGDMKIKFFVNGSVVIPHNFLSYGARKYKRFLQKKIVRLRLGVGIRVAANGMEIPMRTFKLQSQDEELDNNIIQAIIDTDPRSILLYPSFSSF